MVMSEMAFGVVTGVCMMASEWGVMNTSASTLTDYLMISRIGLLAGLSFFLVFV
jgi:hypothetical protein